MRIGVTLLQNNAQTPPTMCTMPERNDAFGCATEFVLTWFLICMRWVQDITKRFGVGARRYGHRGSSVDTQCNSVEKSPTEPGPELAQLK